MNTYQTLSIIFTKLQVEVYYKGQLYYIPIQEFKELKGPISVLTNILKAKHIYFETF
jgi:hypothetical protein